jgi:hypothetical protein
MKNIFSIKAKNKKIRGGGGAFLVIGLLAIASVMFLPSQAKAFYLDVGFGTGLGWTSGWGPTKSIELDSTSIDFSLKIGGGPIDDLPLYIVGEIADAPTSIGKNGGPQLDILLIGPGIIYYPLKNLQLGATVGYAETLYGGSSVYNISGGGGFGYDLSIGGELGLGRSNSALILGAKWMQAFTSINVRESYDEGVIRYPLTQSYLGLFLKYAYRSGRVDKVAIASKKSDEYFNNNNDGSSNASNNRSTVSGNSNYSDAAANRRIAELEAQVQRLQGQVEAYEKILRNK